VFNGAGITLAILGGMIAALSAVTPC
jgi:hypothetical protein